MEGVVEPLSASDRFWSPLLTVCYKAVRILTGGCCDDRPQGSMLGPDQGGSSFICDGERLQNGVSATAHLGPRGN